MARRIKFALEMADGYLVRRDIEELREHFDISAVMRYFKSGKLTEWLEDRFYDSEADKIRMLDKEGPDSQQKICSILGVEQSGNVVDAEYLERINEKEIQLRQLTNDQDIISHAAQTALTQNDLADLIDMEEPVIYLCGKKFRVPARISDKRYVGILGKPKVEIDVTSAQELMARNITFENVELPWSTEEKEMKYESLGNKKYTSSSRIDDKSNIGNTCNDDEICVIWEPRDPITEFNAGGHMRCMPLASSNKIDITDAVKKVFPGKKITEGLLREFARITNINPSELSIKTRAEVYGKIGNTTEKSHKAEECMKIFMDEWQEFLQFHCYPNIAEYGMKNKVMKFNFDDDTLLDSRGGLFPGVCDTEIRLDMVTWDVTSVLRSSCESLAHYCGMPNDAEKQVVLRAICQGEYEEADVVYVRVSNNLKTGWAFTKDSFCYGGRLGQGIIPYANIADIYYKYQPFGGSYFTITCKDGTEHSWDNNKFGFELISGLRDGGMELIARYLNIVKNI